MTHKQERQDGRGKKEEEGWNRIPLLTNAILFYLSLFFLLAPAGKVLSLRIFLALLCGI
jgi:hypothetical protein